jgi:polyketide biosynthesis enoyl-CoA hydratase PksI
VGMSEPLVGAAEVVDTVEVEPGIVRVTMRDREHRNAFSPALVEGLSAAFDLVRRSERPRVVVVTGYDSYFSSGGTQDGLLAIHEGRGTFTDVNLYGLVLECEVPVIAAMQGHAIGGGLVMGLGADFAVLSRESVYSANFMKYGFTPGMGATLILPSKLGVVLGHEMLTTAASYRGAELAARGVPYPVVPRADVLARAMSMARDIADKPKESLRVLKAHLSRHLRDALPDVIERELAMHEVTFRGDEVRRRVVELFRN